MRLRKLNANDMNMTVDHRRRALSSEPNSLFGSPAKRLVNVEALHYSPSTF